MWVRRGTSREASEGSEVFGELIEGRLEFVKRTTGADGLARLKAELVGEDVQRLASLDPGSWYPLSMLLRLDRTIARVILPGHPDVIETMGEEAALRMAERLSRTGSLTAHEALVQLAAAHSAYESPGTASYRALGDGEGDFAYAGDERPDPLQCRARRGELRGLVRLATGSVVSVEETSCQCRRQPECCFRLRWGIALRRPRAVAIARVR